MSNQPPPQDQPDFGSGSDLPPYGSFDSSSNQYPPPGGGGSYYPPPTPGYGAGGPFSAPGAISYGWRKFKENWGVWVLATLALLLASIVLSIFVSVVFSVLGLISSTDPFAVEFSVGGVISDFLTTFVSYLIYAVLYKGALDTADGQRFDPMSTISRLNLGAVVSLALLLALGSTVGLALCVLPGIVFMFFSWFAMFFVVDTNQGAVDSIVSSFKLVTENIGNSLLLALLSFLVMVAGILACCVGIFVTIPVATIASAYAFRKFQGQNVAG